MPYKEGMKHPSFYVVSFPDLPYNEIHDFWNRSNRFYQNPKALYNPYSNENDKNKLVREVEDLLESNNWKVPDFSELKETWSKVEKPLFQAIEEFIPDKKNAIKSLTFYPSAFGTQGSFSEHVFEL